MVQRNTPGLLYTEGGRLRARRMLRCCGGQASEEPSSHGCWPTSPATTSSATPHTSTLPIQLQRSSPAASAPPLCALPNSCPCPDLPTLFSSTSTYVTAAPPPGPVTQCRSMLCPMPSTSLHREWDCAFIVRQQQAEVGRNAASAAGQGFKDFTPLPGSAGPASFWGHVWSHAAVCACHQLKRTNATSALVQYCSHRWQR